VAPDFLGTLWAVAYGDAISAARFTSVQTQALLARLTDNLSSPVSVSRMARELSTSRTTLTARIDDLHATYLTWPCYRSEHGMPKLRAQARVYFTDPLLARLASHRHPSTRAPDITSLSEQQIGLTLRRHAIGLRPGTDSLFDHVLYHRTPSDQEIDFVGGDQPITPVESKYVDGQWRRAAQTMRAAFGHGLIATRSVLDLDGDAWAVPAPLLALVLDQGS
jgi:predicted AAA+ superfamily ATPase